MYLKNILIVCSALFSQYANGAKQNYPEDMEDIKLPDFPKVCRSPRKIGGTRQSKIESEYQWMETAVCFINQPGRFIRSLNFHEHYH